MERHASARSMTGFEGLLTAMGKEEVKPETKKPRKTHWQQLIIMACFGIFTVAAVGKGFLYLDTEISTAQSAVGSAVKELNTLKAEVTATDTREQLTTTAAEIEDLKATNTQLRAEVEQIREAYETLKAKNNVVPGQHKRR